MMVGSNYCWIFARRQPHSLLFTSAAFSALRGLHHAAAATAWVGDLLLAGWSVRQWSLTGSIAAG